MISQTKMFAYGTLVFLLALLGLSALQVHDENAQSGLRAVTATITDAPTQLDKVTFSVGITFKAPNGSIVTKWRTTNVSANAGVGSTVRVYTNQDGSQFADSLARGRRFMLYVLGVLTGLIATLGVWSFLLDRQEQRKRTARNQEHALWYDTFANTNR